MKKITAVAACAVALSLGLATLFAADKPRPQPRVDAKAMDLLKQMGATLAGAKSFSVDVHATTEQLLNDGQKIQFARNSKVAVRRPNGLVVSVTGDNEDSLFVYDGKTATLLNNSAKAYVQAAAPETIDETLDMLATKYSVVLPLADLLFADPYKALSENLRSGQYIGLSTVFDTKCHHLAFRQEGVDWQIWIDAGEKPLPVKLVITYKESAAHLEYTAFLGKWNLSPDLPASKFTFTPPEGAKKVEFTVPASQPATMPR